MTCRRPILITNFTNDLPICVLSQSHCFKVIRGRCSRTTDGTSAGPEVEGSRGNILAWPSDSSERRKWKRAELEIQVQILVPARFFLFKLPAMHTASVNIKFSPDNYLACSNESYVSLTAFFFILFFLLQTTLPYTSFFNAPIFIPIRLPPPRLCLIVFPFLSSISELL